MRDYEYDLSQVYHHRFRVEEAAAELKAMRQAPPNTYLPKDIRGAELGYDFWRSRLRITEDILRRYHPDQPRVPAGNPDGGQWTDGGGGSWPASNDRLSPTKIDFPEPSRGSPQASSQTCAHSKARRIVRRGAGPHLVAKPFASYSTAPSEFIIQGAPERRPIAIIGCSASPKDIVPLCTSRRIISSRGSDPKLSITSGHFRCFRQNWMGWRTDCVVQGQTIIWRNREANQTRQLPVGKRILGTQVPKSSKTILFAKYPESLMPASDLVTIESYAADETYGFRA